MKTEMCFEVSLTALVINGLCMCLVTVCVGPRVKERIDYLRCKRPYIQQPTLFFFLLDAKRAFP